MQFSSQMMAVAMVMMILIGSTSAAGILSHQRKQLDDLHDFAWAHHAQQQSQLKMASSKPMHPHGMTSAPSSSLSLQQAVTLAKQRKEILQTLVETDPESALTEAYRVPDYVRESLPIEVSSEMEQFLSATGSIHELGPAWTQELLAEGAHENWQDQYVVLIQGKEYQVNLWGRRTDLTMAGGSSTHIHGIVVPGTSKAAILDTPYRVVTSQEAAYYRSTGINTMQMQDQGIPSQTSEDKIYGLGSNNEVFEFNSLQEFKNQENKAIKEEFYTRASVSYTNGGKSMLWIQISFPDKAFGYTTTSINSLRDNMISYYSTVSNSSTTFSSWDVVSITMPANSGTYGTPGNLCNTARTAIDQAARPLITAAGYNLNNYDRWLMAWDKFTTWGSCWAGLAYVGAKGGWINTGLTGSNPTSGWDVVAHELGHNWSFRHANAWDPSGNDPTSSSGTMRAYYDKFDVMGYGGGKVMQMHFNTYNKIRGNWFDPSVRLDLTAASTSGVYRLYAMDVNNIYGTPRMIAFPKDAQRTCFIEFRQAIAPSSVSYNAKHGVLVKWALEGAGTNSYGKQYETDLLDMRPWTSDQRDAILGLGDSFTDTSNSLSKTVVITPIKIVPDYYVDVRINFGPFTGNNAPSTTLTKLAYSSAPRNVPVPMRVKATDADGDALSYYWDYQYSATALSRYFGDDNSDLATYSYTSTGTKTVRMVVSDGKTGKTATTTTISITSGCNCNGKGTCTNSKCVCIAGYAGAECDMLVPTLTGVNPATNVQTGGVVTVTGSNFTNTDFVRCKYTNAGTSSWATYVSATAVTCNVPVAGAGVTQETITVSPDTVTYSASSIQFQYNTNSAPPTPTPTPTPAATPTPAQTPTPTPSSGGDPGNSKGDGDNTKQTTTPTDSAGLTPEETGGMVGSLIGAACAFACFGWVYKVRKDGGSVSEKFSNLRDRNSRSTASSSSSSSTPRQNVYAMNPMSVQTPPPTGNRGPPPPVPPRLNTKRVLYAYQPQGQGELAINPGDQVVIKSIGTDGWSLVALNGEEGYVPSNYLST